LKSIIIWWRLRQEIVVVLMLELNINSAASFEVGPGGDERGGVGWVLCRTSQGWDGVQPL
jgi:hypothetical protein